MGLKADPNAREFCPASGKARMTKGEAKSIEKRGRGYGAPRAYKCRACRGWHVGNLRRFNSPPP